MARFRRTKRLVRGYASRGFSGAGKALVKAKKAASSARRRVAEAKKKTKILTIVSVAAVGALAYFKFQK